MEDHKASISARAAILNVELTYKDLSYLNQYVNDRVSNGLHVSDALDYCYFYIKDNYTPDDTWGTDGDDSLDDDVLNPKN